MSKPVSEVSRPAPEAEIIPLSFGYLVTDNDDATDTALTKLVRV